MKPDIELVRDYERLCKRVGQLLIGECSLEAEPQLFDVLLYAEQGMYMEVSDGLGCS